MDEKLEKIIKETMTKPRWISTANALMKLLDPKIVKLWGKKYIWWGDYHWRLYYSPTKNPYMAHINYVVKYFKGKNGRLLDVGCGEGLIMKRIAEESNLDCFGIDTSPLAIELAHQRGILNCKISSFEEFLDGNYDFVYMGDLLEHVQNPVSALRKAKFWLVDDGTLFLSLPLQDHKGMDDLHYFTPKLVKELIEQVFVIESICVDRRTLKAYFTARTRKYYAKKLKKWNEAEQLRLEEEKRRLEEEARQLIKEKEEFLNEENIQEISETAESKERNQ